MRGTAVLQVELEYGQTIRGTKLIRVICRGDVLTETLDALEEVSACVYQCGHLILDLSKVAYIDRAGLHLLIRLRLQADLEGVFFEILENTPQLWQQASRLTDTNCFFS